MKNRPFTPGSSGVKRSIGYKFSTLLEDSDPGTGIFRYNNGRVTDNEGKNVNVFNVIGVFINGKGFWKIPVEYVSGTLPANGSVYYYVFNCIANRGASGVAKQGNVVTQGNQGNQETTRTQGVQSSQRVSVNQSDQSGQFV